MFTRPRLILIVAAAACILSVYFVATRSLRNPEEASAIAASPPVATLEKLSELEDGPSEVLPAAPIRREAELAASDSTAVDARLPTPEAPSADKEKAIRALTNAQEFAASFPSEGPLELSKSTSELAFIQACVGQILFEANRGIEVGEDSEIIRVDASDDEAKFFHDGRMFIVGRGEFPIFDEARDRLATDVRPPRSPRYYEEYQQLFVQALESLGVEEPIR